MPKTFAEALREQLTQAGITAYRLSQLTGISQGTMSKLLAGTVDPRWDSAQKIIKALGVSCEVFMLDEVTLPDAPDERGRGRPKDEQEETSDDAEPAKPTPAKKSTKKGKGK